MMETGELKPVEKNVTAWLNELVISSYVSVYHYGRYGFSRVVRFRPLTDDTMLLVYDNGVRVLVPFDEPLIVIAARNEEQYHAGSIETGWRNY